MTGPQRVPDAVLARLQALHPKTIDLSLDRIEALLADLGHPERRLPPVIHVAGTNGKGSVVAYLRAMTEAAGLRAHVYTSPHLVRFAERIRVAGRLLDDADLAGLLEECERVNAGRPITFFEITTAAALLAFARQPADVCLLETGLGGRLDATNVVKAPALTALTPIALDHQQFLGGRLEAIAAEKAGILKPGVACVVADQPRKAGRVIELRSLELGVPLLREGRDWFVRAQGDSMVYEGRGVSLSLPTPALPGRHQMRNAALAVACLERLRDVVPVPAAAAALGLRTAAWPARLQRLNDGPLAALLPAGAELWLDGGHNPAAGKALGAFARHWRDAPLHLVVGMMANKDAAGFLAPLLARAAALRAVPVPGHAGAADPAALVAVAQAEGMADAAVAPSVAAALRDLAAAGPARVLICGSLYLAGAVLAENGWTPE